MRSKTLLLSICLFCVLAKCSSASANKSADSAKVDLQALMDSARRKTPKHHLIDKHCQEAAALLLKQTDANVSIPFLVTKLGNFKHKHEQSIAMHALIILNDKRAEQSVKELLKHKDPNVFRKAQRVLSEYSSHNQQVDQELEAKTQLTAGLGVFDLMDVQAWPDGNTPTGFMAGLRLVSLSDEECKTIVKDAPPSKAPHLKPNITTSLAAAMYFGGHLNMVEPPKAMAVHIASDGKKYYIFSGGMHWKTMPPFSKAAVLLETGEIRSYRKKSNK